MIGIFVTAARFLISISTESASSVVSKNPPAVSVDSARAFDCIVGTIPSMRRNAMSRIDFASEPPPLPRPG
ncbi:MAG TPA: hypothetical protein VIK04_16490 [Solirubrobacteraceae bacterium]